MCVFFLFSSRFYIFTVLYLFDRCFLFPHLISFYLFSTFFFQLIFILFTLCSFYKNAQESCHFRENISFNFKEKKLFRAERFGCTADKRNPYVAFRRRFEKMQTRRNRKFDENSYTVSSLVFSFVLEISS